MKNKYWPFGILLMFGCNLPPDLPRDYFFGEDTAICAGVQPLSFSTDLVFEVDVIILAGYSRDYNLEYLETEDISFTGTGQYVVESIVPITLQNRAGPVAVLIDQHQSYALSDSSNFRSKQINQFLHELPASSSILLGGFSQNGLLSESPVEFATPFFTADPDGVMPFLFGLSKRTGGLSVLFDAAASTLTSFSSVPSGNLVMVVQGRDSVSTSTVASVINTAVSQSVAIDVVFFGDINEAQDIAPLSAATGGLFVFCATDLNLVTAFNHLNHLYTAQSGGFRVKVKFTPAAPLTPGQDTVHEMIIHDSLYDTNFNSIPINVKVP